MPVDIILADNHPLFRKGTGLVLESNPDINLVAEAENGGDLIEKCRKFNPNIVILDLKMPGMSGVEILKVLSNEFPGTSIIVLSMVEIINSIFEVISAGAKAYVLKSSDVGEILNAITSVQKNEVYYCEGTEQLLSGFIQRDFNKGMKKNKIEFSKVELTIIRLICKQLSNKEIADELFLSVRTIEWHRTKILEMLNVKSTVGIVIYALENKIYSNSKELEHIECQ